jgi:hypothetical protein
MLHSSEQASPITAQQLEQAARGVDIEALSLILLQIFNIPEIVMPEDKSRWKLGFQKVLLFSAA